MGNKKKTPQALPSQSGKWGSQTVDRSLQPVARTARSGTARSSKKQRFTLIYVQSFTLLDGINHLLTQRPYFQAEIFHKPLVSQEVARHVGVAVIDQRSEAHREQLQIRILHGPVQRSVANAHVLTANKPRPSTPFKTFAAPCKVTMSDCLWAAWVYGTSLQTHSYKEAGDPFFYQLQQYLASGFALVCMNLACKGPTAAVQPVCAELSSRRRGSARSSERCC